MNIAEKSERQLIDDNFETVKVGTDESSVTLTWGTIWWAAHCQWQKTRVGKEPAGPTNLPRVKKLKYKATPVLNKAKNWAKQHGKSFNEIAVVEYLRQQGATHPRVYSP